MRKLKLNRENCITLLNFNKVVLGLLLIQLLFVNNCISQCAVIPAEGCAVDLQPSCPSVLSTSVSSITDNGVTCTYVVEVDFLRGTANNASLSLSFKSNLQVISSTMNNNNTSGGNISGECVCLPVNSSTATGGSSGDLGSATIVLEGPLPCLTPNQINFNWDGRTNGSCGGNRCGNCGNIEELIVDYNTECGSPGFVNFLDVTTGGVQDYSYLWDFDDGGAQSTAANPTYEFSSSSGSYSVSLTVTDARGNESVQTTVVNASDCAEALSVNLINYEARVIQNQVKLNWSTASEYNNDHFLIQENSIQSKSWKTIGIVKGAGTKVSSSNYEFLYNSSIMGSADYRLVQVDYDGQKKLLGVKTLYFDRPKEDRYAVFPVPVKDQLSIVIDRKTDSHTYQVLLYNINGSILYDDKYSEGLILNMDGLPAQLYFVEIRNLDLNTLVYRKKVPKVD